MYGTFSDRTTTLPVFILMFKTWQWEAFAQSNSPPGRIWEWQSCSAQGNTFRIRVIDWWAHISFLFCLYEEESSYFCSWINLDRRGDLQRLGKSIPDVKQLTRPQQLLTEHVWHIGRSWESNFQTQAGSYHSCTARRASSLVAYDVDLALRGCGWRTRFLVDAYK
jgi:hypothetical protein